MLRGLVLAILLVATPALAAPVETFPEFLVHFKPIALAAGVDEATYDSAMTGIKPDDSVPDLVQTQPEFTTPIWDYIDKRASDTRIKNGIAAMKQHKKLFARVGKKTGVDPALLGAIWGIETNYGSIMNDPKYIKPIIPSLATLVWQRRTRLEGDTIDLIAALKLIKVDKVAPEKLVGSWAGAIGHLQVNPSNVLTHGTDGDGDGVIDLNNSLADALMTSAKFLLDLGYKPFTEWGFEVSVPADFNYLLVDRSNLRPISFFEGQGVKRARGGKFADPTIPVFLYVPAGAAGPKFLLTANYQVLKGYNLSDSYAMAVAHLADRLKGAGDFAHGWPRDTKFPNLDQRKAIQEALAKLGYYKSEVDGRIGPGTQAAYAKYQAAKGEVADGFVTLDSYEELTKAK